MKLHIKIKMDSSAFSVQPERECAWLLSKISEDLMNGSVQGTCIDTNGNTVGEWEILS